MADRDDDIDDPLGELTDDEPAVDDLWTASLAKVSPEFLMIFVPCLDGRGGFIADWDRYPPFIEKKRLHDEELAALDKQIADLEAETEQLLEKHRAMRVSMALSAALRDLGVKGPLIATGASALRQSLGIIIEGEGEAITVSVDGPHGRISVADAVSNWLAGIEGSAFRPPPPKGPGKFATAIRELRTH